jgi:LPS-assembly protein
MNSEAVAFHKSNSVEGSRVDLYPYVDADYQGSWWFIRPKIAYRYTSYSLDAGYQNYETAVTTPTETTLYHYNDANPSRSLPIVSLDEGLIFDRSTSLFGTDYTQTLEPRLYYLYVPVSQPEQPAVVRYVTDEL